MDVTKIFLRFTESDYSTGYKILAMIPGTLVFLVISPLVIFWGAHGLSRSIPLHLSRSLTLVFAVTAFLVAGVLMLSALFVLWVQGDGTPAPIAPTRRLVTSGPYRFCRNPIELGTELYLFGLGALFGDLVTGFFCLLFGFILGAGYIKLIEEKELLQRFGPSYATYRQGVPFMLPHFSGKLFKEPGR